MRLKDILHELIGCNIPSSEDTRTQAFCRYTLYGFKQRAVEKYLTGSDLSRNKAFKMAVYHPVEALIDQGVNISQIEDDMNVLLEKEVGIAVKVSINNEGIKHLLWLNFIYDTKGTKEYV